MRKIKFKVNCKKHNREETYTLGDLIMGRATTKNGEGGIFENWRQYAGLKDKNGKEIYEGDIVRVKFRRGFWKYKDKMYYGYKNGSVEYCVDCFIVYINGYKETIYPLSSFGDTGKPIEWLEVIGNIYDNPELLERSSNGD